MSRLKPRFTRNNAKLPVPANNVYRVKVLGQIENQLTINTFYYSDQNSLGTANLTHMQNLQSVFVAAGNLFQQMLAATSADWAATQIIIDCPTSPSLAALNTLVTNAGSGPAGHEPTEVAAIFIRRTGVKGQCGRGRFSMPAVPTTWVTLSRVTTLTFYNGVAGAVIAVLTGGGDTFTPALFSRNGSHAFPGVGASPLTGCVFSTLLGTVRRRKIGRGK